MEMNIILYIYHRKSIIPYNAQIEQKLVKGTYSIGSLFQGREQGRTEHNYEKNILEVF